MDLAAAATEPEFTMDMACNDMFAITNGLPLAIVLLGRLLLRKEFPGQWAQVLKHLKEMKQSRRLEGILALCYEDLPHYLRPCFLHFAMRPENTIMNSRMLVRMWAAEGFLKSAEGETMEDVGRFYLKELISRGMIHLINKSTEGEVHRVTIHQQLHAMARSETQEATFLDVYGPTSIPSPTTVRHLFLQNMRGGANIIHMGSSLPKLRSVLCDFPEDSDDSGPTPTVGHSIANKYLRYFGGSQLLRVMELKGLQVTEVPRVIGSLIHLRYLCIRSRSLAELPSSIANLTNLQTLDISGSKVEKVTGAFWRRIPALRHVLAEKLRVPRTVRLLNNMQGLKCAAGIHPWHGTSPVHNMVNLQTLVLSGLTSHHWPALLGALGKLESLLYLNLRGTDIPCALLTTFSLRRLHTLELTGKMDIQGEQQQYALPSLIKLVLQDSMVTQDFINKIGMLPCLATLELSGGSYAGQQLAFSPSGFAKLKNLKIRNFSQDLEWTIGPQSLSMVTHITVENCTSLRLKIQGKHMSLKNFELCNMPQDWDAQEGGTLLHDKVTRTTFARNQDTTDAGAEQRHCPIALKKIFCLR
jgi:Leucine-rich repeat (LRR) protein